MKCKKVQEKLSAYLDGGLPPGARSRVSQHLEGCPRCAEELDGHRALGKLLDAAPAVAAPDGFARSVCREAVRRAQVGERRRKVHLLPRSPVPVLMRVAAMLAVAVGLVSGGVISGSAAQARGVQAGVVSGELADELPVSLLSVVTPGSVTEAYLDWVEQVQ